MARKSHNKRHKGHRRGRRGGSSAPLHPGPYPGGNDPQWHTSVTGGRGDDGFKTFIQQHTGI